MNSNDEIFANPPLHEVAFEVRFPHLFYINQRIGEFQLEIMDDFPKSSQISEQAFAIDEKGISIKDNENPIPKKNYQLLFQSAIREIDNSYKYIMDFDGYSINVEASNFLNVTDELKHLIKKEFLSNITENFKEYMRMTNE
ncbi:hypothetical protein B6V01_004215 [Methanosarcinales archaeon ex4572_44]|nr:MAG: hypothetical protein B6V01_004215 [Methanosarcinales archaeon ex4572_44]